MPRSLDELQSLAKQVRREIVQMIGAAKSGTPAARFPPSKSWLSSISIT